MMLLLAALAVVVGTTCSAKARTGAAVTTLGPPMAITGPAARILNRTTVRKATSVF